jgi:amino acid transporter
MHDRHATHVPRTEHRVVGHVGERRRASAADCHLQRTDAMSLRRLLLGRALANREQAERKIGAFEGVPAMGLDALGSAAYGPEAALTVLIPLGAAGLAYVGPIIVAIVSLLAIIYLSYRQTIAAYPSNGGAYIVSKTNLGTHASLFAASALMLDYVLNVAVGISAGVAALVSAVSSLHPYILELCLGILGFIAMLNLRGTQDAARVFALPTYTFVASFLAIAAGGAPAPVASLPALPGATESVGLWLLLRAFASGCTAMTGVEAVSNGVSAFKQPVQQRGRRTLTAIVVILALLLAGIAYLVKAYGILAMDQRHAGYQSVLSQLAGAVVGRGRWYQIAIGSLLCVLTLSANTSFVDFPRLCRCLAEDGFLPRPFAVVGRRLVYSAGILYLAAGAGVLLVVFGGITDRLIPLFAIGAFLTFSMSQAGMVVHWLRAPRRGRGANRLPLIINAVGASVTSVALVVIVAAKLTEGAWITLLVIPGVVVLLKAIRGYYARLDASLRDAGPVSFTRVEPPVVLVVTRAWNKLTDKALGFALQLSPDVNAVHFLKLDGPDAPEAPEVGDAQAIREQWSRDVVAPARAAGLRPPRLLLLRSDYRVMHEPLLKLIKQLEDEYPSRLIAVLLPEIVTTSWWQVPLHTRRTRKLRSRLLRFGGSRVVLVQVPWYLDEPRIEQGIVEGPT